MYTKEDLKKGAIIFKCPDHIHNNYGIQIYHSTKPQFINQFEASCIDWFNSLKKSGTDLRWFLQGRQCDWCYFEFWNGEPYQDLILDWAETLSEVHELPLLIE
jgi:hypothetical protein